MPHGFCEDAPEPVPDKEYPGGTQESANANQDEAGPAGKRDAPRGPGISRGFKPRTAVKRGEFGRKKEQTEDGERD
ncbi:hypothetical protein NDU88_005319 [Pleurodeles waltl]|uniref:Uncharacterized protein n=1 Tax=Pleurodeles waltl TaxID=8319 RepID=A0AAV7MW03_PLEWA|nr:hypothetical protein NDU88_005319 [Pleurodeles waltl]